MITKLSRGIAFYFVEEGIVEECDADLYRYGMETIFCSIFDIGIVLISGIVFGRLGAAIWYYLVFCILRSLSEGYHAKTFGSCKLMMILMMCGVMGICGLSIRINIWHVLGSAGILAGMLIRVSVKCRKWMYLLSYIFIELALIHWKNSVAILTMCAFLIVGVASNIKR